MVVKKGCDTRKKFQNINMKEEKYIERKKSKIRELRSLIQRQKKK